jgi:hypothetical protein
MGHYTNLRMDVDLRPDTPADIINFLEVASDCSRPYPIALPKDFPFDQYGKDRQTFLFRSGDTLWDGEEGGCVFEKGGSGHRLNVRAKLKNYGGEIEKLCSWLSPYVTNAPGSAVGDIVSLDNDYQARLIVDHTDGICWHSMEFDPETLLDVLGPRPG